MSLSVILEFAEIATSLGNLDQTLTALYEGIDGIAPGPTYGVSVPSAPFADRTWKDLHTCIHNLALSGSFDKRHGANTLFVFCAAKGDIRGLEGAQDAPSPLLNQQAALVQELLGLSDSPGVVISNACASGSIGIEYAAGELMRGRFSRAVVVAFDTVSRFVTTGFNSLGALSPEKARPFDAERTGLTLGDGAACAVLTLGEPQSGAITIAGWGSSNDANHRTGPSRTGEGLAHAATEAIACASITTGNIGAVKCHGTATNFNDAMEAKALVRIFGDSIPPCCSLKGALGHTSGASSLLETIIAAEALRQRLLPPTAGFKKLGVEEPIPVSMQPQVITQPAVLCLAAGFGGVNAALVLRHIA